MARRNPNLLLLSRLLSRGSSRRGLTAVAVWTVLSTVVLAVRLLQGVSRASRHGALRPWLEELGDEAGGGAAVGAPVRRRPCRRAPSRAVSSVLSSFGPHARKLDARAGRPAEPLPPRITGEEPRRHPLRVALISNPTSGRNARRGLLAGIADLLRAHPARGALSRAQLRRHRRARPARRWRTTPRSSS